MMDPEDICHLRKKKIHLTDEQVDRFGDLLADITHPTKADTAEHYPFYFYSAVDGMPVWSAPLKPNRKEWCAILQLLKEKGVDVE